jgi:hypothetical protein
LWKRKKKRRRSVLTDLLYVYGAYDGIRIGIGIVDVARVNVVRDMYDVQGVDRNGDGGDETAIHPSLFSLFSNNSTSFIQFRLWVRSCRPLRKKIRGMIQRGTGLLLWERPPFLP